MHNLQALFAVLTLVFVGVVGFYLQLIARFYRMKFGRGPQPRVIQLGLLLFLAGLVLRLPWFANLPPVFWQGLLSVGGLVFSGTTYMLYRSMMTPQ
jgi:uncharacterized membrane protein YoaK (UPF0700 family)